ncbi:conserved protein, unknown function [Hepatocystis sp. ex Piliocolobus tephrosceles]|nr:conserved protein, unknown function [Hepatocystis sp. ex Piliocolobus tephrosceles]
MNENLMMFEDNNSGNEKKKRKMIGTKNNNECNPTPTYFNELINNNNMGNMNVNLGDCNTNSINTYEYNNYTNIYKQNNSYYSHILNENSFSNYQQINNDILQLDINSSEKKKIQFDKGILINSIDVLLNFIKYNALNEAIKNDTLHENLINLRFYILSLSSDKLNQKKITEYFPKM